MENKKQTAVELLYEKMYIHRRLITIEEFNQALQMEKDQIIEAHDSKFKVMDEKFENGGLTVEYQSGLGYYNEKYGK